MTLAAPDTAQPFVMLLAPTGGVTAGVMAKVSGMVCVPRASAPAGSLFPAVVSGRVTLAPAGTSQRWTPGQNLYWDATNLVLTSTVTGTLLAALSADNKALNDTTGSVWLRNVETAHLPVAIATTAAYHRAVDGAVSDQKYVIVRSAETAGTIDTFKAIFRSGSQTLTLKIGSTSVTGGAGSFDSTGESLTPSAANAFVVGDEISVTGSAGSSPVDLALSLLCTATP